MTALSLLALQSAPSPLPLAVLSPHHHPPRLIPTSLPTSHFITAVTIPSPPSSFTPILPPHRRSPNHPLSSTPPSSHLISVLPPHRCPPHFITGILPPHHHPPISPPPSISSPTSHLITILPISPPPSHLISVFPISPPPSHLIANLPPHHHPPISPPPSHLISVFPTAPSLPQHHHLLPTGSSGALDSSAPPRPPSSPQQFNCHLQSPLTIPCS